MQTCLEHTGLQTRPVQINRNDYKIYDQYNVTHPNALSDGDVKGKGTGHGGHTHYTPDCTKTTMNDSGVVTSSIDYSNFDTFAGGGLWDIEGKEEISHSGRERLTGINNFGPNYEYGPLLVNTEANVQDGQVVF
jgi:hypothetical protein